MNDPDLSNCRGFARRFLRRWAHTTYTADDLVQDCWVAFLEGRGFYHRRMVDAMRSWHEADVGWRTHFEFPKVYSVADIPERSTCNTESDLARAERDQIIAGGVESLPPMERLVILLYFWEGKRLREIGAVLGLTLSRASQLRTAGLLRLAKKLRLPLQHNRTTTANSP